MQNRKNKETSPKIQKTLETMLVVQRELQETQIKQSEEIKDLLLQGKEQDRRIQQLIRLQSFSSW